MKHLLTVRNRSFEFQYDEQYNRWLLPNTNALLSGFNLGVSIDLANDFPGQFSWDLMEKFLAFWIDGGTNIREKVVACPHIMHTFLGKADSLFLSEQQMSEIEFWPGTIKFKGYDPYYGYKFLYDLAYLPANKNNPYEDMGSIVWYGSFVDTELIGINRDY